MENNSQVKHLNCIMLVDDNFIDNFAHKKLLESMKIANSFLEFTKPQEAIEYLILFNCFSQKPNKNFVDLILLDINMPIMDGWHFVEEYKKACNNIKPKTIILLLSSSSDEMDIQRSRDEVFINGFIQKPLTKEKLLSCFASIQV